jgi:formylglycine-generating enzyme required for sulfatase activity
VIVRIAVQVGLVLILGVEQVNATIIATLDTEHFRAGVVRITATPPGENQKVGTGFIVRLERDVVYIVTASHVVSGDAQPKVQFFAQRDVYTQATVRHSEGADDVTGLALLVVRGRDKLPSGLTVLTLASGTHVLGNEEIMLIGHPSGAGDWVILNGNIASRQGRYLIVDANIDEGNSGGPIIQSGEVVGLVGAVTRYGRGVTSSSIREYLEGHGINIKEAPAAVAKVQPTPSIPIKPEKPEVAPGREIIGRDGAPMVLIPAGEFWMGSPDGEGNGPEHPRHQVYLDAFYIDQVEVTVSRYAEFLRSMSRSEPLVWYQADPRKHGNLPVVGVDWNDADAYCRWAGKRLPTEAEWEKAARGTDERRYPWGTEVPTNRLANFGKDKSVYAYEKLAPVESYETGKSPYGVYHMAGNVWEWVADWYDENYYAKSLERNPKGPSSGQYRVQRGGSWGNKPVEVRSALRHRLTPTAQSFFIGFRCAQDTPP